MKDAYIERIRNHPGIKDTLLEYALYPGERYIYGMGEQAATCLGFFREMQVEICGILTLPGYDMARHKGYWGRMLSDTRTVDFTEIAHREEIAVLLAIPRSSYGAACECLHRLGIERVFTCDWEHNQYLRDICASVRNEKGMA